MLKVTITTEEVIYRVFDFTQNKITEWFISKTEKINHEALVLELWIEDNQEKCITGLSEEVLCGMG